MTAHPGLVVDASVAAKWHLTDEPLTTAASHLLTGFSAGTTDLIAPALIRYEVAQTLLRAARDGRIENDAANSELSSFLSYGIHASEDDDDLLIAAQLLARATGASVYDAVYIAYAELHGYELVTADDRLVRQVAGSGLPVRSLSEFTPA